VPDDTATPEAPAVDEADDKAGEATKPTDAAAEDTEPTEEATESPEDFSDESEAAGEPESVGAKRRFNWPDILAYGVLPALALLLALAAGFARWEYVSSSYGALPPAVSEQNPSPALESMNAAKDSTIKILSYKPDNVEQQLNSARDLLTGDFRDSYTSLINDVVIPGAKEKQISAVASVPAMASVSADPRHAVVMVFVNQTVVIGRDAPSDTASSVRVTMEKLDGRWLISEFEPV
jgi:Mce-associated membrane protein